MTIVKGLKNINALVDKPKYDENSPKVRWLKLADGQSAKIRFIEELDEDSANYNPERGLALVVKEHTNPKDYSKFIWKLIKPNYEKPFCNKIVD